MDRLQPTERVELNEQMLDSFEKELDRLREKALAGHLRRMNIVKMLAASSGMDNQQQVNFINEIDKLFKPPYREVNTDKLNTEPHSTITKTTDTIVKEDNTDSDNKVKE